MRLLFTLAVLFISYPLFSQRFTTFTDGLVSQFWQQKMYYNAGATGYENKKIISITGAFDGSFSNVDRTENFYNSLVTYEQRYKQSRSSFGLFANYNQAATFYKYFSGALSYSYALPLGKEKFLRFGAQAGIKNVNYISPWRTPEQKEFYHIKGNAPFVNSGLFFNSKTFYGSVSIKSLYQPKIVNETETGWRNIFEQKPVLHFTACNTFFKERKLEMTPNVMFVTGTRKSIIFLNNTLTYKQKYSLGASYIMERINTLSVNACVKAGQKLEFSANYDLAFGNDPVYQGFELMSKFRF